MIRIHEARPDQRASVRNVVDGADLALSPSKLVTALEAGDVLVAETPSTTVLGALVLCGDCIVAVAVRPGRRGQRIGTLLVESAADQQTRLTAEFGTQVAPFWESLDFEIEPLENGRLRGVR